MKVSNLYIIEALDFLQRNVEKTLPQKISFGIIKNISILTKENENYQKALEKIFNTYEEYYDLKDGAIQYEANGLPLIKKEYQENFYKDINELLQIVVDIEPYYIAEEVFDYSDDKYDILTAKDMLNLMTIMVKKENKEES